MAGLNTSVPAPAIVVLGAGALTTARRVQALYPGAAVHGLQGRVAGADHAFGELGAHLRALYGRGTPIVALCAAGIVIRSLASMLDNKGAEPPVLAIAEDGSAVVPLLGGLRGVNVMARQIAAMLDIAPAITTSGELRFGTCILSPPPGYALASLEQGKRFVSDLLAGESTRIEGDAPWLGQADLPYSATAQRAIRITPQAWDGQTHELLIHPRSVVAAVDGSRDDIVEQVSEALRAQRLAPQSLSVLLAEAAYGGAPALDQAAAALDVPLRFVRVDSAGERRDPGHSGDTGEADARDPVDRERRDPHRLHSLLDAALREPHRRSDDGCEDSRRRDGDSDAGRTEVGVLLAVADRPLDAAAIGRARGRLTVIGLGPGSAALMVPAARDALDGAQDVLGYETYVRMAGPFRPEQRLHCSDNREELQRARHAFELASEGRSVVVVSSGDPGVFAMAAAVLEALDQSREPAWARVELQILPGVSAAMATAAQAGAPLGHDFCMLSLSDNLKPWSVIEDRLRHAAAADLVMAFYNPISRARPWQLDTALDIVRTYRSPETPVVLGRDIGRPGASLTVTSLGELRSTQVDMRTMIIIGSSTTRRFVCDDQREWVYTPRWYR
jgi:cobalt-precorrin 5A hydrolase/precorrin-3B C17-methyltransferase